MKRNDVPPTHRLTATAPLLPSRLPMPHGICAALGGRDRGLGPGLWPGLGLWLVLRPGHSVQYSGLRDCLRSVWRADGMAGLYRGIVPNLLKAVPSISISYVVFEHSKRLLAQS